MSDMTPQPDLTDAEQQIDAQLAQLLHADEVAKQAGMDLDELDRRVAGVTRPLLTDRPTLPDAAAEPAVAGRIRPAGQPRLSLGWRIAAVFALASMMSLVVAVWRVDVSAQQTAMAAGPAPAVQPNAVDTPPIETPDFDMLALKPMPNRDVDADLDLLALQVEQVAASGVFVTPDQSIDEAIAHDQVMLWTDDGPSLF